MLIVTILYNANAAKNEIYHPVKNFINCHASGQDTISYLEDNFIAHKEEFQHKELNVLLKRLDLSVKSYYFIFDSRHTNRIKSITLFFNNPTAKSIQLQNHNIIPFLVIYFEDEISSSKALVLYNKDGGNWLKDESSFYGNKIIRDIGVSKRKSSK